MELMALYQLLARRGGGGIRAAWTQRSCAKKKKKKTQKVSSATLTELADISFGVKYLNYVLYDRWTDHFSGTLLFCF